MASEEFAEQILAAAHEGMAVLVDEQLTLANEKFAVAFGYDGPASLIDASWEEIFVESTADRLANAVFPALDADEKWEGQITGRTRGDNRVQLRLTVSSLSMPSEQGDHFLLSVPPSQGNSFDSSAQPLSYRAVLQNIHDAVYTLDADGRITWVNDVAVEEFDGGYTPDELIGSYVTKILPRADLEKCSSLIRRMIQKDLDNVTTEVSLLTADGEQIPTELHLSLLPFEDGTFQGTIGVARDIRGRKRREQQFTVLNRILRHNVRNDMNVIHGRADLLADTIDLDADLREHLTAIQETASDLDSLGEKAQCLDRLADTTMEAAESASGS